MKISSLLLLLLISSITYGQEIDTLTLFSKAFNGQRTVYVHTPQFYNYKSDAVQLPVIYLLDGQHEWFVNPLLSDINFLQYTHEIPDAIVVVIPHNNRNKECGIVDLKTELPLDIFITEELDKELKKYNPNAFKMIVGHSFSASFALYSYYKHPDYYAAVIAHSPLDELPLLVRGFEENESIQKDNISISIGGTESGKDDYHRKNYDQLKEKHPEFFKEIHTFEANNSAHNAVPIVATPALLTAVFKDYRGRFSEIAPVDREYKMIAVPETPKAELEKIVAASKIGNYFYPPQIADINGIASRYLNSDYTDIALQLYQKGIEYYPHFYEFYVSLYELTGATNNEKSKEYLEKAISLLKTIEDDWEGKNELIEELESEKTKNGW